MTPLRDAFVGFFAGAGTVFGAATDADSIAGTVGGGLTITFAATALHRGYTHERVCVNNRYDSDWQGYSLPKAP